MNLREYKSFNYELTVEEYDAFKTTVKVLTKLRNVFNSNVVYTGGNRIELSDAMFYLNALMDNDGEEVYKLKEENARE